MLQRSHPRQLGGGREEPSGGFFSPRPKALKSKDCAKTNEDRELRVHRSFQNMEGLQRGADGIGLLVLYVCPPGQVMFIPLARSGAVCDQF